MAKIAEVKPFAVHGGRANMLFIRIRTDDGREGIGEGTIPHKTRAIAGAVQEFAEYLVGQDPDLVERHWQVLFRNSFHRGGPIQMTALSGIDQALWDLRGKQLDRPVWDLLGGAQRPRVRVYAHPRGSSTDEIVDRALQLMEQGWRAFKLQIPRTPEPVLDMKAVADTVRNVRAVREAVGPDIQLMVDAHGKSTPSVAVRVARELAPYDLLFFEEPIPPGNVDALLSVTRESPIPIAVGERLYSRWDYRDVIERQAAAVLQPDPGHAGGISEIRRIAAAAETYFMPLAPHNSPRGPGVLMAGLHLGASIPNFLILETGIEQTDPIWDEMLIEPLQLIDGYLELPHAPGLGLRFDESLIERYPARPIDVRHPVLADGGVGDW